MKNNWNRERIFMAISIIPSTAVFILALCSLLGVWENANDVAIPLLGVTALCQSVALWKERRSIAILEMCVAIFIFACSIVVWFLK